MVKGSDVCVAVWWKYSKALILFIFVLSPLLGGREEKLFDSIWLIKMVKDLSSPSAHPQHSLPVPLHWGISKMAEISLSIIQKFLLISVKYCKLI